MDAAGNLYGTTQAGGPTNAGTVYKLTPSGSGYVETTLYSFRNQEDGEEPYAGVIFDGNGNMFGATSLGGANQGGTVFELSPASGGAWNFSTIYSFTGSGHLAEGRSLTWCLTAWAISTGPPPATAPSTSAPSSSWRPTVTAPGRFTSLHDFTGGVDGQTPRANLVFDKNGNLYGTAAGGPEAPACGNLCGLVFEITFPQQFVPVPACRVVDTRNTNGDFGGPPIQGGTSRELCLAQQQRLPAFPSPPRPIR